MSGEKKYLYYSLHNTSFGKLFIASSIEGVCAIHFIEDQFEHSIDWLKNHFNDYVICEDLEYNNEVANQLEEYFQGRRKDFDIKLNIVGTEFQKKVWDVLLKIPYGSTWTYKDVALRLGDQKKSRAAGGAIGKNPLVIVVPCHRVVGSNGKLTGFSAPGGVVLKKQLLDLENQE